MSKIVCVKDFEEQALKILTPNVRDFYTSGADDELTLKLNKEAFTRIRILPRMLRGITNVDISTTILGEKVSMPLGFAPASLQKLAHPDGEIASAKAAEAAGTIFTLSTAANTTIEEIAVAAPKGIKWLQLYFTQDKNIGLDMVRRAEKAGFKALVVTIDTPILGNRRNELRNDFKLHSDGNLANLEYYKNQKNIPHINRKFFYTSLTWKDISWLKSSTNLPIVLKGVLTVEDALLAIKYGASAIQISNHGGRQVDGVPATEISALKTSTAQFLQIEVLPEIVKAVGDKLEIYIDGGISQGTDVFKALALGAKMTFFGRPMLWALACDGEKGLKDLLEIMRREISLLFTLSGCRSVKEVTKNLVCHESRFSHL